MLELAAEASNTAVLVTLLGMAASAVGFFVIREIRKHDVRDEAALAAAVELERRLTALKTELEALSRALNEKIDRGLSEHRDLWTELQLVRTGMEANAREISAVNARCAERSRRGDK
jgi:predicted  nucleic acid-binding Zn-ribbon protein